MLNFRTTFVNRKGEVVTRPKVSAPETAQRVSSAPSAGEPTH